MNSQDKGPARDDRRLEPKIRRVRFDVAHKPVPSPRLKRFEAGDPPRDST